MFLKMRYDLSALLALAFIIVLSQQALAVPFGIVQEDQATIHLAPFTNLAVSDSTSFTPPLVEEIRATLPPIGLHDHITGAIAPGAVVDLDATATATGSVSQGAVHAFAQATAPSVSFCSSTGSPCTSGSFSQAHAQESWIDNVLVVGPGNTPIKIQVSYHVSGVVSNDANRTDAASSTSGQTGFDLSGPLTGPVQFRHLIIGTGSVNQTDSQIVTILAGGALSLENFVLATATAGDGLAVGSATSSFLDTASFNLDVLTPGASLLSASGLDYSTLSPTPEPATLFLLGTTLTGLGLTRRRKTRRGSH